MWRSRKPKSWWVTPEVQYLAAVQYTTAVANRQRSNKGPWPKPPKFPEDTPEVRLKTPEQLAAARKRQREHLAKRRAELKKRREERR